MFYDVFNGDADGICSLIQLRLAFPRHAHLVTGVKRDISLLRKIQSQVSSDDEVTVLDISMDKNQADLEKILSKGVKVLYADHHNAKNIPKLESLTALIDFDPNVCTSLIVNQYLNGKYAEWAVVGAAGDNLESVARKLATSINLPDDIQDQLVLLGQYINYNAYGSSYDDLEFAPESLYQFLVAYQSPVDFLVNEEEIFQRLQKCYTSDFEHVNALSVEEVSPSAAVVMMPNAAWARRVSGVYANELANRSPDKAHAIITVVDHEAYQVSVRAPINKKVGADQLCLQFPTGGGRSAAAGINRLFKHDYPSFIDKFKNNFKQQEFFNE